MYRRAFSIAVPALLLGFIALGGCAKENEAVKTRLTGAGFAAQSASELSTMDLTREETDNVIKAKQSGMDEASIRSMVKELHDRKLPFVIGEDTELLTKAGMSVTAITQLVQMGAIPAWSDDVRALKEFGTDDVTIVELAKLRFVDHKEILSGGEYARLKQFRMSDSGLLSFARKGGTAQQLEVVARELAMGRAEAEAMATAGVK
jgi:hypothetical protein